MFRAIKINGLLLATLLAASCDKPPEAPATETPDAPAAPDAPDVGGDDGAAEPEAAADKSWDDMNFDERKKYMSKVYYPAMKEKFQAYNADDFANFTCDTCHGEDGKEKNFQMPNGVSPLDAADPVANGKDMDEQMTQFMMDIVVPETAKMLGEHEGKCMSCHEEA